MAFFPCSQGGAQQPYRPGYRCVKASMACSVPQNLLSDSLASCSRTPSNSTQANRRITASKYRRFRSERSLNSGKILLRTALLQLIVRSVPFPHKADGQLVFTRPQAGFQHFPRHIAMQKPARVVTAKATRLLAHAASTKGLLTLTGKPEKSRLREKAVHTLLSNTAHRNANPYSSAKHQPMRRAGKRRSGRRTTQLPEGAVQKAALGFFIGHKTR